jgi:hypothetical protein
MPKYNLVAPALPLAPFDYDQRQQDQFQSVLRLYFTRLDNYNALNSIPASGLTADRPIVDLLVGQFYFDTSLGIPIWYDGTDWVNASGTAV